MPHPLIADFIGNDPNLLHTQIRGQTLHIFVSLHAFAPGSITTIN